MPRDCVTWLLYLRSFFWSLSFRIWNQFNTLQIPASLPPNYIKTQEFKCSFMATPPERFERRFSFLASCIKSLLVHLAGKKLMTVITWKMLWRKYKNRCKCKRQPGAEILMWKRKPTTFPRFTQGSLCSHPQASCLNLPTPGTPEDSGCEPHGAWKSQGCRQSRHQHSGWLGTRRHSHQKTKM